eukprot:SAG31_NODE_267_length_18790_cov_3.661655_4_plen_58_part_00
MGFGLASPFYIGISVNNPEKQTTSSCQFNFKGKSRRKTERDEFRATLISWCVPVQKD